MKAVWFVTLLAIGCLAAAIYGALPANARHTEEQWVINCPGEVRTDKDGHLYCAGRSSSHHDDCCCNDEGQWQPKPPCMRDYGWRWFVGSSKRGDLDHCTELREGAERGVLCYEDTVGQTHRLKWWGYRPVAEAQFEADMRNAAQCGGAR
jgi:hypothetical protein